MFKEWQESIQCGLICQAIVLVVLIICFSLVRGCAINEKTDRFTVEQESFLQHTCIEKGGAWNKESRNGYAYFHCEFSEKR